MKIKKIIQIFLKIYIYILSNSKNIYFKNQFCNVNFLKHKNFTLEESKELFEKSCVFFRDKSFTLYNLTDQIFDDIRFIGT